MPGFTTGQPSGARTSTDERLVSPVTLARLMRSPHPVPSTVQPAVDGHAGWAEGTKRPMDRRRDWRRLLRDSSLGVLLILLLNLFVLQVSIVRGHSMEPSLDDGDRLVVDRMFATTLRDVDRYDVVVMQSPDREGVDYVKRIVALPGETVSIRGGLLFVDGRAIDDAPYAYVADDSDVEPVAVPEGHVFVLGDNRAISADSRQFGLVASDLLRGRVIARIWPLGRLAFWP